MGLDQGGEIIEGRRGVEAAQGDGLVMAVGLQNFQGRRVGRIGGFGQGPLGGAHDRRIARAAAQIAGQGVVDVRRGAALAGQGEDRHDEARRAEAALGTIEIDQRPLHRVQRAVRPGEMLDGENLAAVQAAYELDAAIDRLIAQAPIEGAHANHRAGAAVAFVAAFLGASQPGLQAQIIEQGHAGVDVGQHDRLGAQEKADVRHLLSSRDRSNNRRARSTASRGNAARPG